MFWNKYVCCLLFNSWLKQQQQQKRWNVLYEKQTKEDRFVNLLFFSLSLSPCVWVFYLQVWNGPNVRHNCKIETTATSTTEPFCCWLVLIFARLTNCMSIDMISGWDDNDTLVVGSISQIENWVFFHRI